MMNKFHQLIRKRLWFVLFNMFAILFFAVIGDLRFSAESIVSCTAALLVINVAALISSRNFPDWK
jgi:hypothetical protein